MSNVKTILYVFVFIFSSAILQSIPPPVNYQISSPSSQLQNEEQVWVCPIDSNIVIADWRDFRLGYRQVGIGRSIDGGNTWTDSLLSPDMQVFTRQSDPCLTVDKDGNFYICVLDYQPIATTIWDSSYISFHKSTDKGISWTGPVTIEDTLGPYFEDKQFITVDWTDGIYSGNIYVAWARFPNPDRIMFCRSTDGAASFDDTLIVGPTMDGSYCGWGTLDAGQFACPLVGNDGSVYVFWIGGDLDSNTCEYNSSLKIVKSIDGGETFTVPIIIRHTAGSWWQVDGDVDVYNQPAPAADITGGPFDGNLYVAYGSIYLDNPEYWDYNIEFIRSTDSGQTWSEPIYINDDYVGPGAMYDQFHPWLVCNEEGTLVVIFYDQRTDPVNHYKFDAFVAYSFDGGVTFTTNHRISDVSIDPDQLKKSASEPFVFEHPAKFSIDKVNPRAGKIAEYIGVTAFKDHINAVWTDTRNGNQDVYGANWVIPLLEPRLISPSEGDIVYTTYPHLYWSTAWKLDDDYYRVEVSENPSFTSLTFTLEIDTPGPIPPPSPLLVGSTYYWRVKAFKLSTGDSSNYSSTGEFTVGDIICFDTDNDGYGDPNHPENNCPVDNCPTVFNPDQTDLDGNGVGDACETCCVGIRGNIDGIGEEGSEIDIADLVYFVDWSFSLPSGPEPPCLLEADVDATGEIDIADIVYMVDYMFNQPPGPNPLDCPTF